MSFVSYFGFGVGCSSCIAQDNEKDNEISASGLVYPTVGSPKKANTSGYQKRPHGSPAQKDAVGVAKHGFEEEIGNENAPPRANAQATENIQQDPVKSKSASKQKDIEKKPKLKAKEADPSAKPKLPRPAKVEDEIKPLPVPKAEEPKIVSPFSDGSKLQVQLETGWVDCSETEMLQIGNQLACDTKKFAIQARGAMYIMDFMDPNAPTQTHAVSKKTRQMRIVKP